MKLDRRSFIKITGALFASTAISPTIPVLAGQVAPAAAEAAPNMVSLTVSNLLPGSRVAILDAATNEVLADGLIEGESDATFSLHQPAEAAREVRIVARHTDAMALQAPVHFRGDTNLVMQQVEDRFID